MKDRDHLKRGESAPAISNTAPTNCGRRLPAIVIVAGLGFALTLLLIGWSRQLHDKIISLETQIAQLNDDNQATKAEMHQIMRENEILKMQVDAQSYDGYYITIDSTKNEISLMRSGELIKAFPCATGRGMVEIDNRKFDFRTPIGELEILYKEEEPIWYRPDWVWIERGDSVPENLTREDRAMEGILGKYRLHLGNSISIHGTSSGRVRPGSITHGCIRVGNEGLEMLHRLVEDGAPIYIY